MTQISLQKPLTVFIVDDDDDIRASLMRGLEKRGYNVEGYSAASSFLEDVGADRTGCLILDYGMPGMNGLELQEAVASKGLMLPIIFISGHGGIPVTVQAIKAGAVDFLEKPFRQRDLVERIEACFELCKELVAKKSADQSLESRFRLLSAREREIAERIVQHPSEVSSKELAARLGISPRTVDHHRAQILSKLRVKSVAELIALAKK
ncbi:response regulator transcription factor [Pseudoruegeria sp. HB172150]|uniref:response regulator transcription factor n=1 Tax=Pseudoruegeria sp. HB172150 TaxID=2721164 RepID=UPI0015519C03|nr:response regulator [Pseudoruegeria sp. HB172150]